MADFGRSSSNGRTLHCELRSATHRCARRRFTPLRLASLRIAPRRVAPHRTAPHRSATRRNAAPEGIKMAKPFELSKETEALVSYLRALDKGALATYRELTKIAGIAIKSNTPKLIHARRKLLRDHNQVWICVKPHVGLRRLNDAEIAEHLRVWWIPGARNKLKNGGNQADVIEVNKLDIDQQSRFAVDSIQRQLAFEALSKATLRRMERIARGTSNDLPAFTAVE